MSLQIEQTFDDKTYRHYTNGILSVMHCHHYITLATKLVEHFPEMNASEILAGAAEDSMRSMIDDYIRKHNIATVDEKLSVGTEFYATVGMGKMSVEGDANGGTVTLTSSHLDKGWEMKWGKRDTGMNYWTQGYISAMFGATFDRTARSYQVDEIESMITGAPVSTFQVTAK